MTRSTRSLTTLTTLFAALACAGSSSAAVVATLTDDPAAFLAPGDANVFILGPDSAAYPDSGNTGGGIPNVLDALGTPSGNTFPDNVSPGGGDLGLYQTFVVDSAFTLGIATLVVDDAEVGDTVGVRIFSIPDASDTFIPAGDILSTVLDTSFVIPTSPELSNGESTVQTLTLAFSDADAVTLPAGDYAFALIASEGGSIDWMRTASDTGPAGVEGGEIESDGDLNDLFDGRDFALALAVPEPSTVALVSLGGLLVAGRRRAA